MHHFEDGYADNDGVKIHTVTTGQGPLVVMIHGFPDFWYTWRHQMLALADQFRIVAVDLRGYNKSDKPKGVRNYTMRRLVGDIVAVLDHFGEKKAVIVGHDWGGAIAWTLAIKQPERVDRLIICNLPHPRGFARELAENPEQQANSHYARVFQQEGAHRRLKAQVLAQWVDDPEAREKYIEAFARCDFEAMLHYYKTSYPREPYTEVTSPLVKVKCPVLMIHGLQDKYLLPGALNDTWQWLESDFTLVTVPDAGHFGYLFDVDNQRRPYQA